MNWMTERMTDGGATGYVTSRVHERQLRGFDTPAPESRRAAAPAICSAREHRPHSEHDGLSSLAPLIRIKPQLERPLSPREGSRCEHGDSDSGCGRAYMAMRGGCVVELMQPARSIVLDAGDIAVLPRGQRHVVRMARAPGAAPFSGGDHYDAQTRLPLPPTLNRGPEVICLRFVFDQPHWASVRSALPGAIRISGADCPEAARIQIVFATVRDELQSSRAGASAIACELASALFVMIVRLQLEREPAGDGLLGLLAHRQAGRAALAMLEDLARPWTLNTLAACANASRASLVRMFRRIVRAAPLEFLTQLRLETASRRLASSSVSIGDIAAEVGYQSESAFSRAFRRRFGIAPGAVRDGGAASGQPAPVLARATPLLDLAVGCMESNAFGAG